MTKTIKEILDKALTQPLTYEEYTLLYETITNQEKNIEKLETLVEHACGWLDDSVIGYYE